MVTKAASDPAAVPAGPPQRRADARRNVEAIIAAARDVLSTDPRASMQQIADAAGVHRATVHRHFPGRDDLIDTLRGRAYGESADAFAEVLRTPSVTPSDTLRRAVTALIAVGDRYRLYRYTTWTSDENQGDAEELGAGLSTLVQAAQAAGAVRTDLTADRLVVVLGGLIWALLPLVADGELSLEQATETVSQLFGRAA